MNKSSNIGTLLTWAGVVLAVILICLKLGVLSTTVYDSSEKPDTSVSNSSTSGIEESQPKQTQPQQSNEQANQQAKQTTKEQQSKKLTVLTEGTKFNFGSMSAKYNGFEVTQIIDSGNSVLGSITTKNKFILISLDIVNNSKSSMVLDAKMFKLIDLERREHNVISDFRTNTIIGKKAVIFDEINPGVVITKTVAFEVPEDLEKALFVASDDGEFKEGETFYGALVP